MCRFDEVTWRVFEGGIFHRGAACRRVFDEFVGDALADLALHREASADSDDEGEPRVLGVGEVLARLVVLPLVLEMAVMLARVVMAVLARLMPKVLLSDVWVAHPNLQNERLENVPKQVKTDIPHLCVVSFPSQNVTWHSHPPPGSQVGSPSLFSMRSRRAGPHARRESSSHAVAKCRTRPA